MSRKIFPIFPFTAHVSLLSRYRTPSVLFCSWLQTFSSKDISSFTLGSIFVFRKGPSPHTPTRSEAIWHDMESKKELPSFTLVVSFHRCVSCSIWDGKERKRRVKTKRPSISFLIVSFSRIRLFRLFRLSPISRLIPFSSIFFMLSTCISFSVLSVLCISTLILSCPGDSTNKCSWLHDLWKGHFGRGGGFLPIRYHHRKQDEEEKRGKIERAVSKGEETQHNLHTMLILAIRIRLSQQQNLTYWRKRNQYPLAKRRDRWSSTSCSWKRDYVYHYLPFLPFPTLCVSITFCSDILSSHLT